MKSTMVTSGLGFALNTPMSERSPNTNLGISVEEKILVRFPSVSLLLSMSLLVLAFSSIPMLTFRFLLLFKASSVSLLGELDEKERKSEMTTTWTTLAIIVLLNISLFVNQRLCQAACSVILDVGSEFETYYDLFDLLQPR